ncbi:hypothetical protein BDZ94DRAFT_1296303 [Collybia nuda]|uniref:Uncharacterized protein n=1 Tax=Collybia nuda TaxID=64659 RepID=A0A9P6CMD0_9AGAR|nr:hypothetical protein BDZ94DRAFT_1296303 [Collybia nuda]
MSQTQLQDIARRLAAAGYTEDPGEGEYLLCVSHENENYSLISKHWTGYFFDNQELISQAVRQETPATYIVTPTLQCVYSVDEEEWLTSNIPRYSVHYKGGLAAYADKDEELHVFFEDSEEKLVHLEVRRRALTTLPVRLATGSPIVVDVFNGLFHLFYVSSLDRQIHYIILPFDDVPEDHIMSEGKLIEGLKKFTVSLAPGKERFDAYVLTEGPELLFISGDGRNSLLGTIDAAGEFLPERQIDRCCTEAWDGTLVADRLEDYLSTNPNTINSPGGEQDLTPLAAACWRGHLDVVELLIDHGADPNALSPRNRTPLFFATTRLPAENRAVIVRILLRAGANVDQCYAEDNFNTPLMNSFIFFQDRDVIRELLAHGASLMVQNAKGMTAGMLAEGTGLENELPQVPRRSIARPSPEPLSQSPPPQLSPQLLLPPPIPRNMGYLRKRLLEIFISIVLLIVKYSNTQDVLDEVLRRVRAKIIAQENREHHTP